MADHIVKILAKEKNNNEFMVKVTNWTTTVKPEETVEFESLAGNAGSNLDVELIFPSRRDSPFTSTRIKVGKKATTKEYKVKKNADGTYKYRVEGKLSNKNKFGVDPRFIVN